MGTVRQWVHRRFAIDPKNLWRRYLLGLGIILALLSLSHVASYIALHETADDAILVKESGRQSTLSQRILHFATAYHSDGETRQKEGLEAAINLFEQTHNKLTSLPDLSDELKAIYFESGDNLALDTLSRIYAGQARVVLDSDDEWGVETALSNIKMMGADRLLVRLDDAVTGFENLANHNTMTMRHVQDAMLAAAIMTLMVEAAFIFWPAQVATRHAFVKLERQKEALSRIHAKLQERNQDLEVMKAKIEYDALHDELTGLANRRYLTQELEQRVMENRDTEDKIAVLHIDLDRFKQINDTLGHAAGDFILKYVARILNEAADDDDIVARVGGDEFVIVRMHTIDEDLLCALAEQIICELCKPVPYEDNVCQFGASIGIDIGISSELMADVQIDQLLVNADVALYKAKEKGRGRYEFFTPHLNDELLRTKARSDAILRGIEHNEFLPHYQLQYDAKTFQPVGAEALVRWDHPEEGLLPPADFMPIAININRMADIDHLMLTTVLRDWVAHWRDNPMMKRLAINLSTQRLNDNRFLSQLRELGVPRDTFSFEVTEEVNLDGHSKHLLGVIQNVQAQGYDIALDDFGAGHASILTMQKIMPQRLKIAKPLVDQLTGSSRQNLFVKTVIDLARSQNVEVVAEGVETRKQALCLRDLGCDLLQGFYFSKPMSAQAINAELMQYGISDGGTSVKRARNV